MGWGKDLSGKIIYGKKMLKIHAWIATLLGEGGGEGRLEGEKKTLISVNTGQNVKPKK